MPELKDSSPQIKQESFKPKIERILNITNKCLSGEITPIDAFRQIVDRNPQPIEATEVNPLLPQNEIQAEQHQTNQEIETIRQEISNLTVDTKPEENQKPISDSKESLINKDKYYLQKEKEFKGKGFIDSHQTSYQKNIDNKRTLADKVTSKINISKLKRLGAKDPEEFCKVLEERGFNVKDMIKYKSINSYLELSPQEISRGIDRVEKLGFEVKLYIPQTKECLKEISAISDADFDNFTSELNEYPFLEKGLNTRYSEASLFTRKDTLSTYGSNEDRYSIHPVFEKLLEHAKNGKLSPEIKNRLVLIKEIKLLNQDPTYNDKSLDAVSFRYKNNPNPGWSNVIGNDYNNIIPHLLSEDENVEFDFNFCEYYNRDLDQKIFDSNFKLIYENIDSFSDPISFIEYISQEQIDQLPDNKKGVINFLKRIYKIGYQEDNYSTKVVINYVFKNQDKIHSSFNDESQRSQFLFDLTKESVDDNDRRGFVLSLQRVGGLELINFPNKKDKDYWEIISSTKNSDLVISFIDNKDQFFDKNNYPKPSFFKTITKSGESTNHYSYNSYFLKYLDDDCISKFPIKDKVIWTIIHNIPEDFKKEKENFLSKIDELSEFINQSDGINPKFFDKIIAEYGEEYLRVGVITDEVLENLPPQDKVFWKLYKDIIKAHNDSRGKEVVNHLLEAKEDFPQFFDKNNNLNSLFFEKMARDITNTDDYKDIFNSYLTQENIDKLTPQDKIFWTLYKSFSSEESDIKNNDLAWNKNKIQTFLINNKTNFNTEYLNQENKLTSSFMMAIVKGKEFYNITEFKSIFTENILNSLAPEDKSFWKSYVNADIYNSDYYTYERNRIINSVRNILLEKKDDYKNFFDSNGNPTAFLFESILRLNENRGYFETNLLNLAYLSDEAMANFSPQDKIFWTTFRDSYWLDAQNLSESEYRDRFLRDFLLGNHSDFSKFIDQDFKLNNLFLESVIGMNYSLSGRFLTEEKLSNFLPQDRKCLEIIKNNNKKDFNKFIINQKDKIDDLFDDQNNPTFLFYKTAISDVMSPDDWKHLLTTEQIANFPKDAQKIWGVFKTMVDKEYPDQILTHLIKKQEQFDLFFDKNGNLTPKFLESLIVNEIHIPKDLLSLENMASFPDQDKTIWTLYKDLCNENHSLLGLNTFFAENISDFSKFLDENNKPNVLFYVNYLLKNIDINSLFLEEDSRLVRSLNVFLQTEARPILLKTLNDSNNLDKSGFFMGKIFQSNYKDKETRALTPIGLCAWRVYQEYLKNNKITVLKEDDLNNILNKINTEIEKKRHYLDKTELEIPSGLKVSFGTEIEIVVNGLARTGEITNEEIVDYKKLTEKSNQRPSSFLDDFIKETQQKINLAKNKYKEQVGYVTKLGVGRGGDATHEFANEPVTNYSVLLWELYEIYKLGFINLDRKFLQYVERGMHLTISGDKEGIKLDGNANLFQNALSASGFSTDGLDAVGASEVVDAVEDESAKLYKQIKGFILERNSLKNKMFDDSDYAKGVENRSFRIDSFNHLARTLMLTNRLAIPLKAYQQYINNFGHEKENPLLPAISELIKNNKKLSQILEKSNDILPEIKSEKYQKSIIIWAYFRDKTVKAFDEKQKNISRYKLKSPLENYNSRDITRLGAELFEVFGGISDEGIKLDDALKGYHDKVETNSLPEVERKIILEVITEVGKLFKKPLK